MPVPIDYSRYVGLPYEQPHGCFKLVERVFRECYGWDVSGMADDLADENQRVARLHDCISRYAVEADVPAEGDIVLIRSAPWHVGVVTRPPLMLHQFAGGHSSQSDYSTPTWRNRIAGFYRYVG